jgi:DNA polymerase-3 subunit epsilon
MARNPPGNAEPQLGIPRRTCRIPHFFIRDSQFSEVSMPSRNFAVIDFETTGLMAGRDRIIEVAAVIVRDGDIVDTFAQLMDPGYRIPSFITELTGISTAMVRGQPRPEDVMPELKAFLADHICVAHNAAFDARFFSAEMSRARLHHDRQFLCSMNLARRLVQDAPNHKLGTLVDHLCLSKPAGMQAHRALADALMTVELWNHLSARITSQLAGRQPGLEVYATLLAKSKAAAVKYLQALAAGPSATPIRKPRRPRKPSIASGCGNAGPSALQ